MNLIELVSYFRKGYSFENFCKEQSLNLESEVLELYMEKPFSINNEVSFFEIEKTEGRIEYEFKGITYHNLLDAYYFLDMIKESNEGEHRRKSDIKIAEIVLSYAIHDA